MWEGCEEEGCGVERVVLVTEGGRHIRSQLCERERITARFRSLYSALYSVCSFLHLNH